MRVSSCEEIRSSRARCLADLMPRYKLTIEYVGSGYSGWQRQLNAPSIQEEMERAATALAGEPITVWGAGRTDSGVHALGQVAHIDMGKPLTADKVRDALNYHLRPHPIAVVQSELVDDAFHSRFSAMKRHYLYRLSDRRPDLTFDKGRVWRVFQPIDAERMDAAAQALVGHHDFTTFRDSQCQAESPVKTLSEITVFRAAEEVQVIVAAPSFLHRQVRSIVGSLVEVGKGKKPVDHIARILQAADRSKCGPVAPPDGLYLTRVDYPET